MAALDWREFTGMMDGLLQIQSMLDSQADTYYLVMLDNLGKKYAMRLSRFYR
jgi:hypothetical protein